MTTQDQVLLVWENDNGDTVSARFDVVPTTNHETITELTEFPVANGSIISDHARQGPKSFSFEGIVSNTPASNNDSPGITGKLIPTPPSQTHETLTTELDLPSKPVNIGNFVGKGLAVVSDAIFGADDNNKAKLYQATNFVDRIREMSEALEAEQNAVRLIEVITPRREYPSMIIRRISEPVTAEDGSTASFSVELGQLSTATSQTVDAPQPAEPLVTLAKAKGSQSVKTDPNDAEKKAKLKQSWAAKGFDSVAGALGL